MSLYCCKELIALLKKELPEINNLDRIFNFEEYYADIEQLLTPEILGVYRNTLSQDLIYPPENSLEIILQALFIILEYGIYLETNVYMPKLTSYMIDVMKLNNQRDILYTPLVNNYEEIISIIIFLLKKTYKLNKREKLTNFDFHYSNGLIKDIVITLENEFMAAKFIIYHSIGPNKAIMSITINDTKNTMRNNDCCYDTNECHKVIVDTYVMFMNGIE
jgi:hypothetical protein